VLPQETLREIVKAANAFQSQSQQDLAKAIKQQVNLMERILVIEDHGLFRSQISELIADLYPQTRVFQAQNGREGIELAKTEKPDVILLDMHMPVMDGCETAKTLRAMPETCEIPLIAMTLLVNEQSQTLVYFRQFCNATLFKPFQAGDLATAMKQTGLRSSCRRQPLPNILE
jgi:CheY-like chemotaxis protein